MYLSKFRNYYCIYIDLYAIMNVPTMLKLVSQSILQSYKIFRIHF